MRWGVSHIVCDGFSVTPLNTGGFYFNNEAAEDVVLLQFYGWLALFVIPIAVVLESNVRHLFRHHQIELS